MEASEHQITALDGQKIFVRRFSGDAAPKAAIQVIHGMCEHSGRYARLAEALTAAGYVVYASDHRGHGLTATDQNQLGYLGDQHGWRSVVRDLECVLDDIRARHPHLPVFVLGHSMGSYLARTLIAERGHDLAGVILSASTHGHPATFKALRALARVETYRLGKYGRSPLLRKASMDAFNKPFQPARTAHDWLSRDPAEVDQYDADPLCGFEASTQMWHDLLGGLAYVCGARCTARYPKGLPILVVAGEKDPTLDNLKGLRSLQHAFRDAGLADVTTRVYPGARHELFNETNRDEVTQHLIEWLDQKVP